MNFTFWSLGKGRKKNKAMIIEIFLQENRTKRTKQIFNLVKYFADTIYFFKLTLRKNQINCNRE